MPEVLSKPVFIIGSARAGTELMVQILNRHPQIMIAAETHYFDDLRPRLGRAAHDPPDTHSRDMAQAYFAKLRNSAYGLQGTEAKHSPNTPELTDTPEHHGIDAMFQHHCLRAAATGGKNPADLRIWGEKTPRHVFCLSEINNVFPAARFIFMQRDPRAVIASYRDWQNHFIDPAKASAPLRLALADEERRVRASFSIGIAAMMWRAAQKAAARGQKDLGSDRFYIQRFEDLLANPQQQIAGICAFLDLEPYAGMQAVGRINSSYGHIDNAGIDQNAAQAWQRRLADHESWVIEKLCKGPMARAGYRPFAQRAHPVALLAEVARTAARVPRAFKANQHRMGSPLRWVLRRLGIG